ncbi:MAG: protein-disulfide reductase, partial [Comamonas sp.]|nr:protein-disulfide reductase [Candidatus Comamonas equi]
MTPSFSLQRLRCLPVWLTLCFIALCFIVSPAHAQLPLKIGKAAVSDTVTTPRVQAQLVLLAPQGVAAGQPVELGLRITHQPDWHTYWKNAGDSGLPTQLDWQLPQGLRAGEVAWPVPQQIRVGDLLNYGYEGTVLLPVPVQVDDRFTPDAQGMVDIRLNASWLVCRVECIPEEGQFHLRVAAQDSQALWASEFAAAHAQVPPTLEQAQASITALPAGDRVSVRVAGLPAAALGQTLAFYPEASDTFQHAAVLDKDWTQAWEGDVWTAELPLSNMRGETPAQLAFVLGLTPSPAQAWRIEAPVQGRWRAVQLAEVSPALQATLEANRQSNTTAPAAAD